MFNRLILAVAAIAIFMVVPSIAGPRTGCNLFKFTGSFTRPLTGQDVLGDGDLHSYIYQLNVSSDGSLLLYWTGAPDYMINAGLSSPFIGAWTCRADGTVLVNYIYATYTPVLPAQDPSGQLTSQDVKLARHYRVSQIWRVDSDNQISVIQSRARAYAPADDPTNPTVGSLANPSTTTPYTYTRLIPSDADLLAPVTP